jgi:3-carboxy-cis,cis-muconate cycloisomerase
MSPTFDPGFTTPEMTELFSSARTVHAILEFEAALALCLAEVGAAPEEEARAVAEACSLGVPDPDVVLASAWESGTPLLALRSIIEQRLAESDRRWFHYGATSQDAIDTGRMLQARPGLELLESGLIAIAHQLKTLMEDFRGQAHMARTFLQEALPTTFGARAAHWLAPTLDRILDLREARERLRLQLGGPSGDLAIYGGVGSSLAGAMGRRLGLQAPLTPWHSDRSPVWALARTVEATALTMGKIAADVALLAQTGVEEITVRPGGSSSMPGKRNPIDSVRAIAAAACCSGFATMIMGAPTNELDRGVGGWHVEWLALPMLFHTAGAAVASMEECLSTLEVDRARMSAAAGQHDAGGGELVDRVLDRFRHVIT